MRCSSSRACTALAHAQDPGCGDLPDTPTTERFLFLLHAALQAGMLIGWLIYIAVNNQSSIYRE